MPAAILPPKQGYTCFEEVPAERLCHEYIRIQNVERLHKI
jgi:hypothetical protein